MSREVGQREEIASYDVMCWLRAERVQLLGEESAVIVIVYPEIHMKLQIYMSQ